MLRTLALGIVIFVALIFALSMGEDVGRFVFQYLGQVFDALLRVVKILSAHSQAFIAHLWSYMQANRLKVLLALVLTAPITYWLVRQRASQQSDGPKGPSKQVATGLAFFLGWLGAHRFYLNQIGWGLAFLACCYIFPPLALILGWVDALRYALMDKTEFTHLYTSTHLEKTPR